MSERSELLARITASLKCTGWDAVAEVMVFKYKPKAAHTPELDLLVRHGIDKQSYVGLLVEILSSPEEPDG